MNIGAPKILKPLASNGDLLLPDLFIFHSKLLKQIDDQEKNYIEIKMYEIIKKNKGPYSNCV
jgi:hypothetical protein